MRLSNLFSYLQVAKPAFWHRSGADGAAVESVPARAITLDKKTVLVLPSVNTVGTDDRGLDYFDLLNEMLGKDAVSVYFMTYRNAIENMYNLKRFNWSPSTYCGNLAARQAKTLFGPLIREKNYDELRHCFRNLTVMASSYGAAFARQMGNELARLLEDAGYDTNQQRTLLREIDLITIADVARENESRGLTTVAFRGLNDQLIHWQTPEYVTQGKLDPKQTTLVISPDRRITTVYCANPSKEVMFRQDNGKPVNMEKHHTTEYYTAKKSDARENGVPLLIENIVRHMVKRRDLLDPTSLLEPETPLMDSGVKTQDDTQRKIFLAGLPVFEGNVPRPDASLTFTKVLHRPKSLPSPQSHHPASIGYDVSLPPGVPVPGVLAHAVERRGVCKLEMDDMLHFHVR